MDDATPSSEVTPPSSPISASDLQLNSLAIVSEPEHVSESEPEHVSESEQEHVSEQEQEHVTEQEQVNKVNEDVNKVNEEEEEKAVSYHNGNLRFLGLNGNVKVFNGKEVVHDFVHAFPKDSSKVLQDLIKLHRNLPAVKNFRKRKYVLETDLLQLTAPSAKKAKTQELVEKLKKLMDRDVRTGLCRLPQDEVELFLEDYCEKNLSTYTVWKDSHVDFQAIDFIEEERKLDEGSTLSEAIHAVKSYSSHLKKSESETLKSAYFVGKAVNICRTKFRQSWNDTLREFDFCENTLRNYENLYMFLVEYPRFLRVSISYTALVKYSKKIKIYMRENEDADRLWRNIEG